MTTSEFLSVFKAKEAKRFKLKVAVLAVVRKNDEVLLLRRFQTGIDDGSYVFPMGGHDGKEPLTSALIREVKEEINLDVKPEDLSVCHVMHRFHPMPDGLSFEQMDVFFDIRRYEGTIHNNEPDRCDDLSFFPLNNLPSSLVACFRHALECIQRGQFYSEYGFQETLLPTR